MSRGRPAAKSAPRAWQRMLSGRRLDLLNPSPMDVEIEDIAHGLARVARWNGQTQGPNAFSVAQHSLVVEQIVGELKPALPVEARLASLLHDAPEYVIGDMISPFKAVLGSDYKSVEGRLALAIHQRFGLPGEPAPALKKLIKRADLISAWLEATCLAGFSSVEADQFFIRPPQELELDMTPLSPSAAQAAFLARFAEILEDLDAKRGAA
ncbi:MAG: HD family hydrolase [Hyphomonadaceae bacterium]|nr:HD family hydrolase [Hyphomonadaceae bacterium]